MSIFLCCLKKKSKAKIKTKDNLYEHFGVNPNEYVIENLCIVKVPRLDGRDEYYGRIVKKTHSDDDSCSGNSNIAVKQNLFHNSDPQPGNNLKLKKCMNKKHKDEVYCTKVKNSNRFFNKNFVSQDYQEEQLPYKIPITERRFTSFSYDNPPIELLDAMKKKIEERKSILEEVPAWILSRESSNGQIHKNSFENNKLSNEKNSTPRIQECQDCNSQPKVPNSKKSDNNSLSDTKNFNFSRMQNYENRSSQTELLDYYNMDKINNTSSDNKTSTLWVDGCDSCKSQSKLYDYKNSFENHSLSENKNLHHPCIQESKHFGCQTDDIDFYDYKPLSDDSYLILPKTQNLEKNNLQNEIADSDLNISLSDSKTFTKNGYSTKALQTSELQINTKITKVLDTSKEMINKNIDDNREDVKQFKDTNDEVFTTNKNINHTQINENRSVDNTKSSHTTHSSINKIEHNNDQLIQNNEEAIVSTNENQSRANTEVSTYLFQNNNTESIPRNTRRSRLSNVFEHIIPIQSKQNQQPKYKYIGNTSEIRKTLGNLSVTDYLNQYSSMFEHDTKERVPKDPLNIPLAYNAYVPQNKSQKVMKIDNISRRKDTTADKEKPTVSTKLRKDLQYIPKRERDQFIPERDYEEYKKIQEQKEIKNNFNKKNNLQIYNTKPIRSTNSFNSNLTDVNTSSFENAQGFSCANQNPGIELSISKQLEKVYNLDDDDKDGEMYSYEEKAISNDTASNSSSRTNKLRWKIIIKRVDDNP
uniref:Uncharacterized protein n=2 Tax=Clastoptera arizonana TaxID=38151 RepID=A0A1B6DQR3_9HEMI